LRRRESRDGVEPVSPELVLVDPDLAGRLRGSPGEHAAASGPGVSARTGSRRLRALLVASLAVGAVLSIGAAVPSRDPPAAASQYVEKVTICHHTHSQKHPFVTITVSGNALPAHQRHGDTIGPCSAASTTKKAALHGKSARGKKSEKSKALAKTSTDHSRTGRRQANSSSGHSGSRSGHSTLPGRSGNAPGHSGTPSAQHRSPPSPSGSEPGHSGTAASHSRTAPGRSGTAPGRNATAPGHSGTAPGRSGSAPGHGATPPGHGATPPGQGGTPPGHGATPPGHGGTPPGHGATPPGQGGKPPGHGKK
jgi:hypothetical protein